MKNKNMQCNNNNKEWNIYGLTIMKNEKRENIFHAL